MTDAHRPRKRFGQHFLHDHGVLQRIVRSVAARREQAFIEIGPDNLGSFQFGLVRGQLDGFLERAECEPADHPRAPMQTSSDRFAFTWDGFDEMDEVSGRGWMRLTSANEAVNRICHEREIPARVQPP